MIPQFSANISYLPGYTLDMTNNGMINIDEINKFNSSFKITVGISDLHC